MGFTGTSQGIRRAFTGLSQGFHRAFVRFGQASIVTATVGSAGLPPSFLATTPFACAPTKCRFLWTHKKPRSPWVSFNPYIQRGLQHCPMYTVGRTLRVRIVIHLAHDSATVLSEALPPTDSDYFWLQRPPRPPSQVPLLGGDVLCASVWILHVKETTVTADQNLPEPTRCHCALMPTACLVHRPARTVPIGPARLRAVPGNVACTRRGGRRRLRYPTRFRTTGARCHLHPRYPRKSRLPTNL